MFPLFHLYFLSPSSFPMFNFLLPSHYFIFLYQWLNGPSSEMIASNLIWTNNQLVLFCICAEDRIDAACKIKSNQDK